MSVRAEIATLATAGLEQAINTYLQMSPATMKEMTAYENKVIALELIDTGVTLYCLPSRYRISIMTQYHGDPDTILSGRPLGMLQLGTRTDTSHVMFSGDVKIDGDVELGQRFKKTLDRIKLDWEEPLSKMTGDVLAHKIGHFVRETSSWWRNARARSASNGAEYLQQEAFAVPLKSEFDDFSQAVETLRDDAARAEVRLQLLLEKQQKTDNPA